MRKYYYVNIFLIGICYILPSCDKTSINGPRPREPHFDLKDECHSLNLPLNNLGFEYFQTGVRYDQPHFNPHNPDEILYHIRGENEKNRVEVYNIKTGAKRTLLELQSGTLEIDWGRAGWIAISNYRDMYLIKEGGTELRTISVPEEPGYSCAEPDWNPDGTVVGFPFGGDNLGLYGMYLLFDISTDELDTFNSYVDVLNYTRPLAWSSQNKMYIVLPYNASDKSFGIGCVDMTNLQIELIFKNEEDKRIRWAKPGIGVDDVQWSPGGDRLYTTGGPIFCYPMYEDKEIRIKKQCDSRYYEHIAISPDDSKIVVVRVDVDRPNPLKNKLVETHTLYIMDIDGKNERPLFY
ncbi:hypothetical protein GC194_09165 [bacterium]|nr:hypothetical protein [bacterium]